MYEFIEHQSQAYPVGILCDVMGVSRSAYYTYAGGQTDQPSAKKEQRRSQIQEVFAEHKRRDGSRRRVHALRAKGQKVGREFICKVVQSTGLSAIQPRSFVPRTTDSRHTVGLSPNLLLTIQMPTGRDQVWVSDIPYIMLAKGRWTYLACWYEPG
ncbi:IS3 family transposase [Spirosoma arcticum]